MYSHPRELIRALRSATGEAKGYLKSLCYERLLTLFSERPNADLLVDRALRWAEMYVATRPDSVWATLSAENDAAWTEFENFVVTSIVRVLTWNDYSGGVGTATETATIAGPDGHHSRFFTRMHPDLPPSFCGLPGPECIETNVFQKAKFSHSGDAVEIVSLDNDLWILLADGCGKGQLVHLVVQGCALLFDLAVRDNPGNAKQVLQKMQERMLDHIPDGFFVEAALIHVRADRSVTVAAAGGVQVLYRESNGTPVTIRASGGKLLGDIDYPDDVDYGSLDFTSGSWHELMFASDGIYDQEVGSSSIQSQLDTLVAASTNWRSIHEEVVSIIESALNSGLAQQDDLTAVSIKEH